MERKDFIQKLIVNGSLAAVLPALLLQSCEKDEDDNITTGGGDNPGGGENKIEIDLSDPANDSLNETGGFQLLSNNIIVINVGNNDFAALSSVCTHQGCTVSYNSSANNLPCPCHGSVFSINGSVLNGPANSALRVYETVLSDNIITIKL